MERSTKHRAVLTAIGLLLMALFATPLSSGGTGEASSLEMAVIGDEIVFAAPNGTAEFTITVENSGSAIFDYVNLSVSFDMEDPWNPALVNMTGSEGTWSGTYDMDDLGATTTDTITVVVDVPSEAVIGNPVILTVNASADDGQSVEVELHIFVANWRIYNEDGRIGYSEGDSNDYTIKVENLAMDEMGTLVAIDEKITIELGGALPGWSVEDTNGWMMGKTEINSMTAGQLVELTTTITLAGENTEAGDSTIFFNAYDDATPSPYYSPGVILLSSVTAFYRVGITSGLSNIAVPAEGGEATWEVTIRNMGNTADTFSLTVDTADLNGWALTNESVTTTGSLPWKGAGGEYTVGFTVTVPADLAAGYDGSFTFTATSDNDGTETVERTYTATVNQSFGLNLTTLINNLEADPGDDAVFTLTVENTGNGEDTYTLAVEGPWTPVLGETTMTIASGATDDVLITVTVPADKQSAQVSGDITVTVTSEDGVTDDTEVFGVSVGHVYGLDAIIWTNASGDTVNSATVQQGSSTSLKVNITNTGNGLDIVAVALDGAESWITLDSTSETIGIGSTNIVIINAVTTDDTAIGDYTFTVTVTSEDGTTTDTTATYTVSVTEKGTGGKDPIVDDVPSEDDPGFGLLALLAGLGVALVLLRRRR